MVDRRSPRLVGMPARALVVRQGSEERIPFAVRDLSRGGARLVGHVRLDEFERIQIELEFENTVVSVVADVARTDPQNAQVVVVFREVPMDVVEVIERTIDALMARVNATSPLVLVLDVPAEIGAALERDLAQLGRGMTTCTTNAGALAALESPHEAVIVHDGLAGRADVLRVLAEQYPDVRRILLFADQLGSLDHASSSRVDAVLRTPWRIRSLARALGIESPNSSIAMLPAEPDEP
jgi:hypothetical protein